MLTELITAIALLWLQPFGVGLLSIWVGIVLLALIWLVTYCVQVPQHASLALSYDTKLQRRLVKGNWFRTAAWSARGLLMLWMLGELIDGPTTNPVTTQLVQAALQ